MRMVSPRADLAVMTWPTLAWITAWQVMTAAPLAAAASQGAQKPKRKRRPRRRAAAGAKIVRFPQERAANRPPVAQSGTAQIIPLPEIA